LLPITITMLILRAINACMISKLGYFSPLSSL
jgi:hypothetical protein